MGMTADKLLFLVQFDMSALPGHVVLAHVIRLVVCVASSFFLLLYCKEVSKDTNKQR